MCVVSPLHELSDEGRAVHAGDGHIPQAVVEVIPLHPHRDIVGGVATPQAVLFLLEEDGEDGV